MIEVGFNCSKPASKLWGCDYYLFDILNQSWFGFAVVDRACQCVYQDEECGEEADLGYASLLYKCISRIIARCHFFKN